MCFVVAPIVRSARIHQIGCVLSQPVCLHCRSTTRTTEVVQQSVVQQSLESLQLVRRGALTRSTVTIKLSIDATKKTFLVCFQFESLTMASSSECESTATSGTIVTSFVGRPRVYDDVPPLQIAGLCICG